MFAIETLAAIYHDSGVDEPGDLADRAVLQWQGRVKDGETWILLHVWALARNMLATLATRTVLKPREENAHTLSQTGVRRGKSSSIGILRRDGVTSRPTAHAQEHWYQASWLEWHEWADGRIAQYQTDGITVAEIAEVRRLYELYPDTATPEEACERAGVDPRDFRLPPSLAV